MHSPFKSLYLRIQLQSRVLRLKSGIWGYIFQPQTHNLLGSVFVDSYQHLQVYIMSLTHLRNAVAHILTFRSLIHFKFNFVHGVSQCSNFTLLHVAVQFSQHHLLKRLSLPHCIFLSHLSKTRYPQVHGFIAGHSSILAWRIPWTEEPDGLQLMEVQKSLTQLND